MTDNPQNMAHKGEKLFYINNKSKRLYSVSLQSGAILGTVQTIAHLMLSNPMKLVASAIALLPRRKLSY